MKLRFSRQIIDKFSNIKFRENPSSSGSRVVTWRQTDMTTIPLRSFTKVTKNYESTFANSTEVPYNWALTMFEMHWTNAVVIRELKKFLKMEAPGSFLTMASYLGEKKCNLKPDGTHWYPFCRHLPTLSALQPIAHRQNSNHPLPLFFSNVKPIATILSSLWYVRFSWVVLRFFFFFLPARKVNTGW